MHFIAVLNFILVSKSIWKTPCNGEHLLKSVVKAGKDKTYSQRLKSKDVHYQTLITKPLLYYIRGRSQLASLWKSDVTLTEAGEKPFLFVMFIERFRECLLIQLHRK